MSKTKKQRQLEAEYGVPIDWLLDTLHNTLDKSVNQMSKDLDANRQTLNVWMDEQFDIPRRGQSEAERVKWQQMDDEQREQQVAAAHEASRKNHAQFRTNYNGYEEWRDGGENHVKHHRLLAVAEYGFDAVCGRVIHHDNGCRFDNRPSNIYPESDRDHKRLHAENRSRRPDGTFE